MRKKLLSLALALALCLGLAAPAFAAGTKKVVEDETHGVKITMNEFLRVETHRYNRDVWIDEDFPAIDKPVGGDDRPDALCGGGQFHRHRGGPAGPEVRRPHPQRR